MDGKLLLEKQLSTIVAQLEYQTELWIEEMEKHNAEQAIIYEKKHRIQKEIERKETEKVNFKDLLKQAKRWHKANILRGYIEKFEENCKRSNTLSEETREWLSWARGKADWYDPLINKTDDYLTNNDK